MQTCRDVLVGDGFGFRLSAVTARGGKAQI